jgi:hypothetical protein
MREENRIYLAAIRRRMQARYHFENRNRAFANLWHGWVHQCVRRSRKMPQTYRNKWIRGYINQSDAEDFWRYITQ